MSFAGPTQSQLSTNIIRAVCIFVIVWELIPEYIFPLTAGISIFCLAQQHSATFTYLFGGANGNEGLGFLSWCMDWQYVGTSEMVLPMNTLVNQLIGYCGYVARGLRALASTNSSQMHCSHDYCLSCEPLECKEFPVHGSRSVPGKRQ